MKNKKSSVKVLFVCRKRVDSYGISFGLLNSARMLVKTLQKMGIEASVATPDDANGIDREVYNYRPTHVIIHALWVTPDKMGELARRYPRTSWNVRIHSKPAFLAMEGIASEWISGYGKLQGKLDNFLMSANSGEMDECLRMVFGMKSFMLPNTYVAPSGDVLTWNGGGKGDKGVIDVGCFGAVRPLKNHYSQASAAIMYADSRNSRMNFHVNKGREEQGGERVMKNLRAMFTANPRHSLVEHDWYSHEDFVCKVLPDMDVGMQVSLTETFNIVAADMVAAGLPTIGSSDIYWMSSLFHANPNSVDSMVSAMGRAVRLGRMGSIWNAILLSFSNRKAMSIWGRYLAFTKK